MYNPGMYNKKIKFYRQVENEKIDTEKLYQGLEKVRTAWASVKPKTATETYEMERLTNIVTYDVRTRYVKELMDPSLIIEYGGDRFEIRSVLDVREEHTQLAFTCIKISKAGAVEYGRQDFFGY